MYSAFGSPDGDAIWPWDYPGLWPRHAECRIGVEAARHQLMVDNDKYILTSGGSPPTAEEEILNAPLRAGYDYGKYPSGITGFTGMNLQRISVRRQCPAVRVRVGPRGNFKGAVCRRRDGHLVLAACRRRTAAGLFAIHIYESRDRGLTWHAINRTELFGKEMSLTAVPDGSLLMTVESKAFLDDPTQMAIYRSEDGGIHWERLIIDGQQIPRNLIVEQDGSLLMVRALRSAYWQHLYDAAGRSYTPCPDLELLRSTDGGHRWSRREGRVAWENDHFGEVSAVRLGPGRLLASLRANPPGTEGEGAQVTYLTESTDDGATWCAPWIMGNTAEVQVQLLPLDGGRLLATYTNYHLPFGVCAVTSNDGGRSWSYDAVIQLAISADCYTGWATTVRLDGDELITSYTMTAYLNEPPEAGGAARNVCEVVRWRLPEDQD